MNKKFEISIFWPWLNHEQIFITRAKNSQKAVDNVKNFLIDDKTKSSNFKVGEIKQLN
mgnify:CR=1 FL=1